MKQALAWLIATIELVFMAGGVYFSYLAKSREPSQIDLLFWLTGFIYHLPSLTFLVIGMLIVFRLPDNRYGWVMVAFSFAYSFRTFFEGLGSYLYAQNATHQTISLIAYLNSIGWISTFAILVLILLLFPTGQYLSRFWRIVGNLALLFAAIDVSFALFIQGNLAFIAPPENPIENTYGLPGLPGRVLSYFLIGSVGVIAACLLLGIISVIVRYIKSKGVERQQIKWFAFATFIFGFMLFTDNLTELAQPWEAIKETLGLLALPLGIGIAILRYRLYDIDIIIRKTLVYGALTLTLAVVYFGSVVLLQSLVTAVGGQQSAVVTVISTLIIAALFTPLRRRIQNDIDRRFYRKKYDAEKTLAAFRNNLRQEVDLEELSARLLATIEETMQPEHTSLWLKKTRK